MHHRFSACVLATGLLTLALCDGRAADEAPKPAEPGTIIVVDGNGKEQKVKAWKFAFGTRRLTWLAPAAEKEPAKDKAPAPEPVKDKAKTKVPAGPEALDFRDDRSTNFPIGINTLIPVDRVRSIDYDNDKRTVTIRVATSDKPDEDVKLTGTTKFQGENKLVIEAEVDRGDMGIAEIKYQGGVKTGSIRGVRFPTPKAPAAAPTARAAQITAADKEKTVHKVTDLHVLYQVADGGLAMLPTLTFKKTLKVDLGKLKKLRVRKAGKEGTECDVVFKDGEEQVLSVLRDPQFDGKRALVEGLIGRVKEGYKVFPLHTVAEVQLDEGK